MWGAGYEGTRAVGVILVINGHSFSRIKKLKVEDWTKGPQK
jgi:hypothetical protein